MKTTVAIQCKHSAKAFSLVELVVVIGVIALMTSMLLPSIAGFSSTAGRRGAVNIVMNTFEEARVAALESGQNVYVAFADSDFPISEMRYSAFMVFRDATDEEKDPNGDGNTSDGQPYVILKKWTRLPKNIAFKRINNSLVPTGGGQTTFSGLKTLMPSTQQDDTFPVLTFNSSGVVSGGPTPPNPIQIFLYEGYYGNGQDNFTRNAGDLFEKITLSRYTGRAQLDVTTTATQ